MNDPKGFLAVFTRAVVLGLSCFGLPMEGALAFTDVSVAAGITETYVQEELNLMSMDREFASRGGGAVAEDFDGDGWVDLFVIQGGLG